MKRNRGDPTGASTGLRARNGGWPAHTRRHPFFSDAGYPVIIDNHAQSRGGNPGIASGCMFRFLTAWEKDSRANAFIHDRAGRTLPIIAADLFRSASAAQRGSVPVMPVLPLIPVVTGPVFLPELPRAGNDTGRRKRRTETISASGIRGSGRQQEDSKNAAAAAALCIFLQGEAGWEAALIPDDQPVFQNQFCHLVPGVR